MDKLRELAALENLERESRLTGAICAATPDLAADQLRAVKTLVRPWTVQR